MGEAFRDARSEQAEKAALEALNDRFRASLTTYFKRRLPVEETDDMVQEVFVRLFQRGGIANLECAMGYVFQTASSVLNDRLRRRRYRRPQDHCSFNPEQHGDADFTPERVLLGKERLARLHAILLELPEKRRTVFVLRRIEEMSYRDIAAQLKVSISSVEKNVLYATRYITRRLEEEG